MSAANTVRVVLNAVLCPLIKTSHISKAFKALSHQRALPCLHRLGKWMNIAPNTALIFCMTLKSPFRKLIINNIYFPFKNQMLLFP